MFDKKYQKLTKWRHFEIWFVLFWRITMYLILHEINKLTAGVYYTFSFIGNSIFSTEPGVANEILENEPKSCLMVA
jgi:hypothetical protein